MAKIEGFRHHFQRSKQEFSTKITAKSNKIDDNNEEESIEEENKEDGNLDFTTENISTVYSLQN